MKEHWNTSLEKETKEDGLLHVLLSSSPMAARPVTEDNGEELPCEKSLTRCSRTW